MGIIYIYETHNFVTFVSKLPSWWSLIIVQLSSLPCPFFHAVKQLDGEIPSPHTTPVLPINSTNTDIKLKTNKYIYVYIYIYIYLFVFNGMSVFVQLIGRVGVVWGEGISPSNFLTAWRNRQGKDNIVLIAPTMSGMNDASV